MKITLDSKYEIHRKIAKLFVGCEIEAKVSGFLDSVSYDHENSVYVFRTQEMFMGNSMCASWSRYKQYSITIDLDTAEPDLRLAISEAMEFESGGRSVGSITHYFTQVNYEDLLCLSNFMGDLGVTDIQLSREWLESQNVEVSE